MRKGVPPRGWSSLASRRDRVARPPQPLRAGEPCRRRRKHRDHPRPRTVRRVTALVMELVEGRPEKSETIRRVVGPFGDAEGDKDDKSDTRGTRRHPAHGAGARRTRPRAPRRRPLRHEQEGGVRGQADAARLRQPAFVRLFRCRRCRRQGRRDEMRDAVGHDAPTLGLVAGDVRAGRGHQGDGQPASRRSDCVHRGHVDAWRQADARALSAAERRQVRQSHETTVPAAERQAEPRRRMGAGATRPGIAARRARRPRADQPGRRDQGRQTADAERAPPAGSRRP